MWHARNTKDIFPYIRYALIVHFARLLKGRVTAHEKIPPGYSTETQYYTIGKDNTARVRCHKYSFFCLYTVSRCKKSQEKNFAPFRDVNVNSLGSMDRGRFVPRRGKSKPNP